MNNKNSLSALDIEKIYRKQADREEGFAYAQRVMSSMMMRVRGALGAIELSMASYNDKHAADLEWQCIEGALAEIKQVLSDHVEGVGNSVEFERVGLSNLVEVGIDDCYYLLKQRNITVHYSTKNPGITILGDRTMLRQLSVHCILVLASAVDDETAITIENIDHSDHVSIQYTAHGSTVDGRSLQEHVDGRSGYPSNIFADFSKAHKILQLHGGAIDISSDGATFPAISVFLPRFQRVNDYLKNNEESPHRLIQLNS